MRAAKTAATGLLLIVLLAGTALGGAGADPSGAGPDRFAMDGQGCSELIIATVAPAPAARAFVPEEYTLITDPSGLAAVFAGMKVCDELWIDGDSIGPASTSDVGVLIESPDGTDGLHYYQTWWGTNSDDLLSALQSQGWRAFSSHGDAFFDDRTAGLAGEVGADIPWSQGDYTLASTLVSGSQPEDFVGTGWYETEHGDTLTVPKILSYETQGKGLVKLETGAGSPMAQLFDGTEVYGAALFATYDMTGTVGPE